MAATPFIGPTYSLMSRPASVQRTVNMTPVPIEPGNEREGWVFKDVPGLTKVDTTTYVPPENFVISLLHFSSTILVGSGYGFATSVPVTEDVIPRDWTLNALYEGLPEISGGKLFIPVQTGSGSTFEAFHCGCLQMTDSVTPFQVTGDFTVEIRHNRNGDPSGGSKQIIVSAMAGSSPGAPGEWELANYFDAGISGTGVKFTIRPTTGGDITLEAHGTAIPSSADTSYAVTRSSGILRLFVNGQLRVTQAAAADEVQLYGAPTIGGRQAGQHVIPNDFASGYFDEWRMSRTAWYTADYSPVTTFPNP